MYFAAFYLAQLVGWLPCHSLKYGLVLLIMKFGGTLQKVNFSWAHMHNKKYQIGILHLRG